MPQSELQRRIGTMNVAQKDSSDLGDVESQGVLECAWDDTDQV